MQKTIQTLLSWYKENKRPLPWRDTENAYYVLLSEIMLQQTRIEAVKKYFERFITALPDIKALAECEENALLKLWEGLGYYSRAKNLKKAAEVLVRDYDGELPADHAALLNLPGIGAYTAGAIASIAFGYPTPAVDGNVLRVVTRLCADDSDITKQTTKDDVTAALAEIYPQTGTEASGMTQALMELGATVCVPNGAPHCAECPLAPVCLAHAAGNELQYPNKPPKKGRTVTERTVFLLRCGDRYAIRRRPPSGLLAGLWEFPNELGEIDLPVEWAIAPLSVEYTGQAKHIFSHIEWHMTMQTIEAADPSLPEDWVWADRTELEHIYAVPGAFDGAKQWVERRLNTKER